MTGVGLDGQLGFASETTYGTPVTVTQFHAGFLSESINTDPGRIESQGLRAGRLVNPEWVEAGIVAQGDINLELWSQPLATLLDHMLGSTTTTGTDPYTHVATPGSLEGKSLTVQVGVPGDTVLTKTYQGVKIGSWSLTCNVGEIPQLSLTVSAQDEATATALAAASYAAGAAPFVFTQGSVEIPTATEIATVNSFTINGDNSLAMDRHRVGSRLIREQVTNARREFTAEADIDFADYTQYNRVVNGDEAKVTLQFDNGTDSLAVELNARFDGQTPQVGGPDVVTYPVQMTATSGTSDADAVTATLINSETSV